MQKTSNLDLLLYEPNDKFHITSENNSLNKNFKIIDTVISTKVGYAEQLNGSLNLYADSSKTNLIATVALPTSGSGGSGLTESQVRNIITSYGYGIASNYYTKAESDEKYSTKEDLSDEMKQTLDGVIRAWAFSSPTFAESEVYKAFRQAWGLDTSDEPETPTLTGITVTWSADSADVGTDPSTLVTSVFANYPNGASQPVTSYTVTPATLIEGAQIVTVEWSGHTASKTITGIAKELRTDIYEYWRGGAGLSYSYGITKNDETGLYEYVRPSKSSSHSGSYHIYETENPTVYGGELIVEWDPSVVSGFIFMINAITRANTVTHVYGANGWVERDQSPNANTTTAQDSNGRMVIKLPEGTRPYFVARHQPGSGAEGSGVDSNATFGDWFSANASVKVVG